MRSVLLTLAVVATALLAVGCSAPEPQDMLGEPNVPYIMDLTTPEMSVQTYLSWTSYAYRMANSEIATPAMTAEEWVGVDAYIEKNRQDGKGIEQSLTSFELRSQEADESTATLAATEEWDYRYFNLDTLAYVSEPLTASYETTYTLVKVGEEWFVYDVLAKPLTALE